MNVSPRLNDDLVRFRRKLHQHAELSSREEITARLVTDWFLPLQPEAFIEGLGGHGLAVVFNGKAPGKTLMLRAELDALPIAEENNVAYASVTPGVSHTCGHDGHMAILAGVGSALAAERPRSGRVVLLFQPAEETGEGAKRVLEDERFAEIEPDFVFALHNLPKYRMGRVLLRPGTFHCASVGMVIELEGRTSHAAHPEHGMSPTGALSRILTELTELPQSAELNDIYSLATITHAKLGEVSLGIAPGSAEIRAALRAESSEDLARVTEAAERLVHRIAEAQGLTVKISWLERFHANISQDECCDIISKAAVKLGLPVTELNEPLRWCEDFSELTQRYPGAMFGLGSGESTPQLHNPDFDFPDELLPHGVRMFRGIIDSMLSVR